MIGNMKFFKNRTGISSIILFCTFLFLLGLQKPLNSGAWFIYDFWQKTLSSSQPDGVGLVLVDQQTLNYMEEDIGVVYPWPREIYGALLVVAKELHTPAVAFDILFTETSENKRVDDENFAALIKDSAVPTFFPAADSKGSIKDPIPALKNVAAGLGAVHIPRESDKNFRRSPKTLAGKDGPVPTLAEAVFRYLKSKKSPLIKNPEKSNHDHLSFYFPIESLPTIPLASFMRAYHKIEEAKNAGFEITDEVLSDVISLKNRALFIGVSAPGLMDFKPTPLGPNTPGVYLHATALANRLKGDGIFTPSQSVTGFTLFTLMILGLLIVFTARTPRGAILFSVSFALVSATFASYFFWKFNFWLNPIALLLGNLISSFSALAYRFQVEWKERLQLAKSIESSMSAEMVQLIRQGQVKVSRYGERRNVTILFSDLAGFTTLSEKIDAELLVKILNSYFDHVVDIIFKHRGYVDKFIGDAVMALWGAPISENDHHTEAKLALETAKAFQSVVSAANEIAQKEIPNAEPLSARVGVHTGPVIVGNIGSHQRHNYTAIGDAVNLSARLEGLGKQYNSLVLISEDTVKTARAENTPGLFEVDNVYVKGKSEPTRIYSFAREEYFHQVETYQQALASYRAAKWQESIDLWEQCQDLDPTSIMVERSRQALKNGPSPKWKEGVWMHDSK